MANKRWDEFGEDTTLDTTSIVAVETAPASTHVMKKITILNFFKSLFKQNLWELGMAISNPPAGFIALKPDANGFFLSHDSSGTTRKITPIKYVTIRAVSKLANTTVADKVEHIFIPPDVGGMNLVYCRADVDTAGTTNTTDVQLRNVTKAQDMLSTKLTIDSTETSSTTGTAYVIDGTKDDVASGDEIAIDIDAISSTPARGLQILLGFQYP